MWSLGITLVELATALFPYRGCKTDFEVLTKVLTSSPPRLPEDQSFSPEFRDFVQRCLQKDFEARPKYPELLKHRFLQQAEKDTSIDVAGWFRSVAIGCGIQLTSPPQLSVNAGGAGIASSSSLNSVSIQRPSSSASDQNRYECSACFSPQAWRFLLTFPDVSLLYNLFFFAAFDST